MCFHFRWILTYGHQGYNYREEVKSYWSSESHKSSMMIKESREDFEPGA